MSDLVVTTSDQSAIVVAGELDANTVGSLRTAIDAAGSDVRVDLSRCSFIDSSGLSLLLSAHDDRSAGAGSLTIVSPSSSVQRLFDICGVNETLTIESDTPAAES